MVRIRTKLIHSTGITPFIVEQLHRDAAKRQEATPRPPRRLSFSQERTYND